MAKNKSDKIPHYEILFVVSNKFTEDEAEAINQEVKKNIEGKGGKITYSENWGKKKMAYPIQGFNHGYYHLYEFDIKGEKIEKLDQEFKMSRDIIRHMIVVKEFRTAEEIKEEKKKSLEKAVKQNEKEEEVAENKKSEEKKDKDKVNLEDLDEKLDKILETDDLL